MVSELLQDRPRLVKQMGSIIFILVYKRIFKFPLGYLNYHRRSILLQLPSSQNQNLWKLLPKKATEICSYGLSLVLLVPVAKPSQTSARMAQHCMPLECPVSAYSSLARTLSLAASQSSVQCWNSRSGGGVRAMGLLGLHPLISLHQVLSDTLVRFPFPSSGFTQNIWIHKRAGQTEK